MNFAEEACFTRDEKFRPVRIPVTFRLYSVGKRLGVRLDVEVPADYGVYYDPDYGYLLAILAQVAPAVDWAKYVYWSLPDQSRVCIVDPEDDRVVAHLETRKYHGKPVCAAKADAGAYGPNVISYQSVVRRAKLKELTAARQSAEEHLEGLHGDD